MAKENNNGNFIELTNLSKSFLTPDKESNKILDIHRMDFEKAAKYCIKGVSGSGKTTLLNIIAGILLPDTGMVTINNTPLNLLKEAQRDKFRAKNIGYIFQNFNLLQGYTAIENILIAMKFANGNPSREKGAQLLEKVGLKDKINYKPSELSYGQQQRVAIARTLANKPALILADEPTGSLDKQNKEDVINLIINLAKETKSTLIVASHDSEVIGKFENIIEL